MQPYKFYESCSHAWCLIETDGAFRFYVYYAVSKRVTWLEYFCTATWLSGRMAVWLGLCRWHAAWWRWRLYGCTVMSSWGLNDMAAGLYHWLHYLTVWCILPFIVVWSLVLWPHGSCPVYTKPQGWGQGDIAMWLQLAQVALCCYNNLFILPCGCMALCSGH